MGPAAWAALDESLRRRTGTFDEKPRGAELVRVRLELHKLCLEHAPEQAAEAERLLAEARALVQAPRRMVQLELWEAKEVA
jgi:hypothetical protein